MDPGGSVSQSTLRINKVPEATLGASYSLSERYTPANDTWLPYQTRQPLAATIGCPAEHPKAWANSG